MVLVQPASPSSKLPLVTRFGEADALAQMSNNAAVAAAIFVVDFIQVLDQGWAALCHRR
jgi:hypothetical protein